MSSELEAEHPMLSKEKNNSRINSKILAAAISASLGAFCGGTVLSWTSSALEFVSEHNSTNSTNINSLPGFTITNEDKSLVASILTIGALVSAIPAGYLADQFGRKPIMIALATTFLLSWVLIAAACNLGMLLAGRFFAGVGLGGTCVVSPMYVVEIAEPRQRGKFGSYFNLFMSAGSLTPNILGAFANWLGLSLPLAAISLIFGVSFCFMPESPLYLVKKKRLDDAERVLFRLRNNEFFAKTELEKMQQEVQTSQAKTARLIDIITNKGHIRAVVCVVGLNAFLQLTGINAIVFYAVPIFKSTGINLSANICAIIMSLVQVVAASLAMFVIDRAGRKHFLIFSSLGMMLAVTLLGVFFHLQNLQINISALNFIPIFSVVIFFVSFCAGFGPITFIVMHEILSPEIRGVASGLSVVVNWSMAFLVTHSYPLLSQSIGTHYIYYIFAGNMAVASLFVYFVVPETKGKSIVEINNILNK